jgi:4-amino-4-deoxy-L-arabinose transferase-like glycosyltransferase
VELWPSASRPYVGGSTDNSELNLIFGYNGFSRIFGSGGAGPGGGGPGGGGPGGGGAFGGSPGWLRMFNDVVGGQISWLIPFALAGLITGLWLTRRARRTDRARAGWILWGGWMLVEMAVFSQAKGIWHPYYTVALAPPVAAAAGAGALAMWRAGRGSRWLAWVLPVAVVLTAVWAVVLLGRTPGYYEWLKPLLLVGGVVSALALGVTAAGLTRQRALVGGAGVVATASLLAAPAAYSLTTTTTATTGALASAGPAAAGGGAFGGFRPGAGSFPGGPPPGLGRLAAGGPGAFQGLPGGAAAGLGASLPAARGAIGRATVNTGLVNYLKAHKGSAKYLVAVNGSGQSAPIILATGQPVVTMGGFNGSDPAPTLAQLQHLVSSGQLHYVLLGAGGPGGSPFGAGGFRPGGLGRGGFAGGDFRGGDFRGGAGGPQGVGNSNLSAIEKWVTSHGTVVPASQYGATATGTLYYLG